jgi:hypothetical protein
VGLDRRTLQSCLEFIRQVDGGFVHCHMLYHTMCELARLRGQFINTVMYHHRLYLALPRLSDNTSAACFSTVSGKSTGTTVATKQAGTGVAHA